MQMRQFGQDNGYKDSRAWEDDWATLDSLSWFREVERESFKKISPDERMKVKPAKVEPWRPEDKGQA